MSKGQMSEAELQAAIIERMRSIGERDPVWGMIEVLTNRACLFEADCLSNPGLSDALAHFHRGRMAMAAEIGARLYQLATEAQKRE